MKCIFPNVVPTRFLIWRFAFLLCNLFPLLFSYRMELFYGHLCLKYRVLEFNIQTPRKSIFNPLSIFLWGASRQASAWHPPLTCSQGAILYQLDQVGTSKLVQQTRKPPYWFLRYLMGPFPAHICAPATCRALSVLPLCSPWNMMQLYQHACMMWYSIPIDFPLS